MSQVLPQTYEMVETGQLTTHPDNPRVGDAEAIGESIEAHGFFGSLVVQRSTGHVLIGNHRLMAARERDIHTLPVIWLDVDDDLARRIMLVDNRMAELATWDFEQLATVLGQVLAAGEEDIEALGWEPHELEALLAAEWKPDPHDAADLDSFSNPATDGSRVLKLTAEAWIVISDALAEWRIRNGDPELADEPALVALCREYLSA